MGNKKNGVKKGSPQAENFSRRMQAFNLSRDTAFFQNGQQYAIDLMCIVLHEKFGFGHERLKRLVDGMQDKYIEVHARATDDLDKDKWYSDEKLEEELRAACGQYYEPREVRYRDF